MGIVARHPLWQNRLISHQYCEDGHLLRINELNSSAYFVTLHLRTTSYSFTTLVSLVPHKNKPFDHSALPAMFHLLSEVLLQSQQPDHWGLHTVYEKSI